MEEKDLYKVLGITDDEKRLTGNDFKNVISKKYKDLAKKYHPDRWVNGSEEEKKDAEEKFKDISNAYSVLSDDQKRHEYDMGGMNFGGSGFNPFEGFDPFSFFGGRGQQRERVVKGDDDNATISITLEEAFNGGEKEITYSTYVPCSECDGTGSKDKKKHTCPQCNGTGRIVKTNRNGNMISQQIMGCPHCHGTGEVVTNPCSKCKGSGVEYKQKTIKIEIPI
jgi:molecular chaperone DnaJ